ncbi:MAG: formate dehydrogenase subunit gamma [Nitrospira sp.]|nr:MAG: formate dehydrogenase subunit gamma [Nitrospira sp.]
MEPSVAHRVEQVLERVSAQAGTRVSILDLLEKVEAAIGYVPLESIPRLAQSLGVSEAQVAGVLSYYPDLHTQPTGRHVVRVCLGEACLANHGNRVLQAMCKHLQADVGETTSDGRCTVETVYCVGNCGVSPSVVIDEDLYGRVTPDRLPALLERYK